MRLSDVLPEEPRPSEGGYIGETERKRVDDMQWVWVAASEWWEQATTGPMERCQQVRLVYYVGKAGRLAFERPHGM